MAVKGVIKLLIKKTFQGYICKANNLICLVSNKRIPAWQVFNLNFNNSMFSAYNS